MKNIVRQQCQLAIDYKEKNISFFSPYSKAKESKVEGEVSEGKVGNSLTVERMPNPQTDTASVIMHINRENIEGPERKNALFGTSHAVVPYQLALKGGIGSEGA